MKKASFKFKPGAVSAFIILALIFISIAAVVYFVISKGGGKVPFAASNPYIASNLNVSTISCTTDKVAVKFTWNNAQAVSAAQAVYLDYSVSSSFAPGYTTGVSVKGSSSWQSGVIFLKSTKYYWRINTNYGGSNWQPSITADVNYNCPTAGSCMLDSATTVPGSALRVEGKDGLAGSIEMQGIYDTQVFGNLGTINTTDKWYTLITVPSRKPDGSAINYGEYVTRVNGVACKVRGTNNNVIIQGPGKMSLTSANIKCYDWDFTNGAGGPGPSRLAMDITFRMDTPRPGPFYIYTSIDGGPYQKNGTNVADFSDGSMISQVPLDFANHDFPLSIQHFSNVTIPSTVNFRLSITSGGVVYTSDLNGVRANCPPRLNICDFNYDGAVNLKDQTAMSYAAQYNAGIANIDTYQYDISPKDGRVNGGDAARLANYIASPTTSAYCRDK